MIARETRKCIVCDAEFTVRVTDTKRSCSLRCAGRARSGANNVRFNGGLSTFNDGRTIIVHRDGKWSFYYRALMEAHLGRELRSDEVVHHINGDQTDDRIENLQVLTRAEHLAIHRPELLAARRAKYERRLAA